MLLMLHLLHLLMLQSALLTGTVTDAQDRPVKGAQIGTTFALSNDGEPKVQIGYAEPAVISDSEGHFAIPEDQVYNRALVARSADGKTLGFVLIRGKPLVIKLESKAVVNLSLSRTTGNLGGIVSAEVLADGCALGYVQLPWGVSQLTIPSGSVEVTFRQSFSKAQTIKLLSQPGQAVARNVALTPTSWAKFVGKQPPEIFVGDAFGGSKQGLSAYLGKWVLLDFWATWCRPCVAEFPRYFEFVKQHAKQRNQFEILAMHSPDGVSYKAISPAYESLVKTAWAGQRPEFPLLFDATGRTHDAYGIDSYPTTILIDPEGKLVGLGSMEALEAALQGK